MLKTIQMLASSSGFAACRWRKPNPSSFISISSYSLSYPACGTRRPINASLPLSAISTRRTRWCCMATRAQSTMYESKPDNSSPVAVRVSADIREINFCQWCGGPTKHEIPDGEEKMRAICTLCGKITYQNPKMVVGCLIEHDNKVLLCKRNIQPSYGLWTLPAGYLENGESAVEGAMRETWEEARAEVEVLSPFAQLDIPLIGQTYIIFLARLKKPIFSPGPESLECCLFALEDIPFESLAFSSMLVTLNLYIEDLKTGRLKFHYGTINKRPGTRPSDIRDYTLDYHLQS